MVGLRQRSAEFAQDDRLGQGVEIAVAPQATDDSRRLLRAAQRLIRARRGDFARARLRRRAREKSGDHRRRLRLRGEIGFFPFANPAAARPVRMNLEERGKRGEGRAPVRAQRRPFERRSFGRIVGRRGERRQAGEVALRVENRGFGTGRRRRRQDRSRRGRCRLRLGDGDVRIGELSHEVRIAQRRLGLLRRGSRGGSGARQGSGLGNALVPNDPPRGDRRLRRPGDAPGFRGRVVNARAGGKIEGRHLRRRRPPFRRPGDQASRAANGQKRAESKHRHGSSPLDVRMDRSW